MIRIGVISDTHGYLNPKVYPLFDGVSEILHAGDIGAVDIITSLETLAPVQAIHGNIDTFPLAGRYPAVLALQRQGVRICLVHAFAGLNDELLQTGLRELPQQTADVIICGHSHKASLEKLGETYLLNPGSAGRKRFSLRPAVAMITIRDRGCFTPEIIYLD